MSSPAVGAESTAGGDASPASKGRQDKMSLLERFHRTVPNSSN